MRPGLVTDFFEPPHPRAIAHRGDSANYPENTMIAFRSACGLGAPYLEFDVHMTRDGAVVISHDEDLRRTSGENGLIREMAWAEVAAVDAGYAFGPDRGFPYRAKGVKIPSLAETLRAFPQLRFVIEVKQTTPSLTEPMLEVLARANMRRRVIIASEHHAVLEEVRALAPDIPTNLSNREVGDFFRALPSGAQPYNPQGAALQVPVEYESWRLVTPESVAAAHRMGLEVHVWTVNAEDEMRSLLALGVDGILTDFPARLMGVLRG
jgi:glycerophosphoryl diester phosphodiesterase